MARKFIVSHMPQQDSIHDFFSATSKAVFIIPVLLLVFALFSNNRSFSGKNYRAKLQSSTSSASSSSFSFNKDFVCDSQTKEASISAIRSKYGMYARVIKQKDTTHYLLQGDCLYSWKNGSLKGEKQCQALSYVSTIETLFSSKLVSMETLLDFIPQDIDMSSYGVTIPQVKKLLSECANTGVVDQGVFVLPKGVVFSEAKK